MTAWDLAGAASAGDGRCLRRGFRRREGSPALAQTQRGAARPSPRASAVPVPHEVHARIPPLKAPRSALVEFDVSPVPLRRARAAHQPALLRRHRRGRPARPQLRARGRAVGGCHLQRQARAAVHAQGLRRAPARRHRRLPARQSGDARARRRRPPAGRGADRGGQRQRRAGGAAAGRQRQRLERRAVLGVLRLRALHRRGRRAPGAAARRQAHAQDLRHPAGGDRRLQRRLRAGRLGPAQGRQRCPRDRRAAARRALRRGRQVRRLHRAAIPTRSSSAPIRRPRPGATRPCSISRPSATVPSPPACRRACRAPSPSCAPPAPTTRTS